MEQRPEQQQPTPKEAHLMRVCDNLKEEVAQAIAQKADLGAAFQSMKAYAEELERQIAEMKGAKEDADLEAKADQERAAHHEQG